jgi:hypothetical protein
MKCRLNYWFFFWWTLRNTIGIVTSESINYRLLLKVPSSECSHGDEKNVRNMLTNYLLPSLEYYANDYLRWNGHSGFFERFRCFMNTDELEDNNDNNDSNNNNKDINTHVIYNQTSMTQWKNEYGPYLGVTQCIQCPTSVSSMNTPSSSLLFLRRSQSNQHTRRMTSHLWNTKDASIFVQQELDRNLPEWILQTMDPTIQSHCQIHDWNVTFEFF